MSERAEEHKLTKDEIQARYPRDQDSPGRLLDSPQVSPPLKTQKTQGMKKHTLDGFFDKKLREQNAAAVPRSARRYDEEDNKFD